MLKMLKNETGVSSLRRFFESGIIPKKSFDKQSFGDEKTKTRTEEYIQVREEDHRTGGPFKGKVNLRETAEININEEHLTERTEECIPIQTDNKTLQKDVEQPAAVRYQDLYMLSKTDEDKVKSTGQISEEQTEDQLVKDQSTECLATIQIGPLMTTQIDGQNRSSSPEKSEFYKSKDTGNDIREPTQEKLEMDNANMIVAMEQEQETFDDLTIGNINEIENGQISSMTTMTIGHTKPYQNTMDEEDVVKQTPQQNTVIRLEKGCETQGKTLEQNVQRTQCDMESKLNITMNASEKPRKPPLPPKPTAYSHGSISQLKSSKPEKVEKRNDGLSNQIRTRKYNRKLHVDVNRYDTRTSSMDSAISSTTFTSLDSMENVCNVQHMTEVYRHWIKHQVRVIDLLPLLPLDKDDTEIVKSRQRSCPSDAVELLIDIMDNSDIPGIWQSFLDALETLEYIHVSKLLRNETEIHHSHSANIPKLVTHDLKQRICFPDFLDLIYEKELLVKSEHEEAQAVYKTRGSQAAAGVILEYVDKHLPNWDVVFADVLEQSGMADIANLFKFVEQPSSFCSQIQGEQVTEMSKKEKRTRQKKLQERRIQNWKRTSELQPTFSDTGRGAQHKTTLDNKIVDINALCITVSQIQSDVKMLTRGMDELKTMQREIIQFLQND